ncbi:hypothetical protein [Micromonospora sp. WMMD1082]|uniref:hypothetical protein n=1 Tax=Micromonospora sp. WMMD1082 TaxID=3016104 RepID=UPI002416C15A|nr:hypothetical protein [Micromonospora sp. WMMD1082]MDG4792712.1 hypothetical protein [Micromonospora sp. WMMD1082]
MVGTEDLRILFDAVCNSLDFGSGFLDTEEVEALRRLAETLGVDPMVATPSEFRAQYAHDFEPCPPPPGPWRVSTMGGPIETDEAYAARVAAVIARCRHCGRAADERPHTLKEAA